MSLLIPSYKAGFARNAAESEYPNRWKDLRGLWAPYLGPSGLTLMNWSPYGHGLDGTLTLMDPATDWVTTEKEWALNLDGSNDYVDTPLNTYDMEIRRHATFIVTARTEIDATKHLLGDWNNSLGMTIRESIGLGLVFFVYPNNHRITTAGGLYAIGDSIRVAGVMDGGNMYLYLNGAQVGTAVLGEDIGDSAATFKIGTRGDVATEWKGDISSVQVFDRAFSPSEIQEDSANPYALLTPRSEVYPAAVAPSGAISGSTSLTFTASGSVKGTGSLSGSTGLTFTPSGLLRGTGAVLGDASLTFTPTGVLSATIPISGSTSLTFAPSGSVFNASPTRFVSGTYLSGSQESQMLISGSESSGMYVSGASISQLAV